MKQNITKKIRRINMKDLNIRVLPRVCRNENCKRLIMTPITEQILKTNKNHDGSIEICQECKDKE